MKRAARKTAGQMPPLPELDPIVTAAIVRAMRPYLDVLPMEALEIMRDRLVDALTTHPVALDALAEMRQEPGAGQSGTRVKGTSGDEGDEDP
jgi:hypothetical protein